MTPQELKSSILQLAVQGRLVEQRPEEGTAEELYRQIQEEKQRLIKEGKIKKEKPLPEITEDEVPFDIPESWMWVRFGEIVHFHLGKTPPRGEPEWWDNDIPWVSIADMPENGFVKETKEGVSKKALSQIFSSNVSKAGTLLMSFKLTVGRVSILSIDAVHNEAIISIFPFVSYENITRDFLFYILPFVANNGESKNAIKGKTLNKKSINNLIVALPPLAEQKRIVAKIEELLPYIDRYEKAWSRLEDFNKRFPGDMQKSVLQMAIQGKLVEQRPEEGTGEELYRQIQAEKQSLIISGKIKKEKPLPEISEDEIPFDIPESWMWVRLRDLGVTQTGNTPPKSHPEYFGQDIPFITPGDIALTNIDYNNQGISFYGENVARICNAESILQVCIGGSIGKAAITNRKVAFNQQINTITPLQCLSEYLFSVFQSAYFITTMKEKAGGTATPIINRGLWDKLLIPLPPLAEQKRIVQKLEEILPLCEKLK